MKETTMTEIEAAFFYGDFSLINEILGDLLGEIHQDTPIA